MTDKFTPGPWCYYTEPQPNGCPIVGNDKGLMVAMLVHSVNYKGQRKEALANAALISAAPDLLQALESALKTAEFEKHQFRTWHADARTAIAKARGL